MKSLVSVCAFLALSTTLFAQRMPPVLMARLDKETAPLRVSDVAVDVRIVGFVAETTTEMSFTSSYDRDVEGDLIFPLPEGATVSGYSLYINGEWIDGVSVERDFGRKTFDAIIRRRIDPGLVEWNGGNSFKTRIYPIPARGSRKIRVKYVAEIDGGRESAATYRLPLNYEKEIDRFSLRVQVVRPAAMPSVERGSLEGLKFRPRQLDAVAETRLRSTAVNEDLVIALPEVEKRNVLVEKSADGQYYFCVRDVPPAPVSKPATVGVERPALEPPPSREAEVPEHVVVFWDASGSRAGADHQREIDLLNSYFASIGPMESGVYPRIDVDLVLFRDVPSEPMSFVVWGRSPGRLESALKRTHYDGATRIAAVEPGASTGTPDFYILVTDGFSNFGDEMPEHLDAPVYVVASSSAANHGLLHRLAVQTGGRYFNLAWMDDAEVAAAIGQPAGGPLFADAFDNRAKDLLLNPLRNAPEHVSLAGKLIAEDATLTLNYGSKEEAAWSRSYSIFRRDAVEGSMLGKLWAQKKLNELLLDRQGNKDQIIALGKQYGLVTPYTSLIVLDSLQQYVQYRIEPPESQPEMRRKYNQRIKQASASRDKTRQNRIKQVASAWQQRVQWWNAPFSGRAAEDRKVANNNRDSRSNRRYLATRGGLAGFGPRSITGGRMRMARRAGGYGGMGGMGMGGAAGGRMGGRMRGGMGMGGMGGSMGGGMGGGMGMGGMAMGSAMGGGTGGVVGSSPALAMMRVPVAAMPDSGSRAADRPTLIPQTVVLPPSIVLAPRDRNPRYLIKLATASEGRLWSTYMQYRRKYRNSPAFYWDCADCFERKLRPDLAVQVLGNLAEVGSDNPAVLRALGHRLVRMDRLDMAVETFEQVLRLGGTDRQARRDLALALARRADRASRSPDRQRRSHESADRLKARIREDYSRSLKLLYEVITENNDRPGRMEMVALMEANQIARRARAFGVEAPHERRLLQTLDCDLRIVVTPISEGADVVLRVIEPTREAARPGNERTAIGGLIGSDNGAGAGDPHEYVIRAAMPGRYRIAPYVRNGSSDKLLGGVMARVDVFTDYGRPAQQQRTAVCRLAPGRRVVTVGDVLFSPRFRPRPGLPAASSSEVRVRLSSR